MTMPVVLTIDDLTAVWSLPSAIAAVISGLIAGMAVGWFATNPSYSAGIATALRVGILTAVFTAAAGLSFFALQTLGSYLSHDALWYRVPSRYGQWVVFSVSLGITTWALVRCDRARRTRRARDLAVTQNEAAA